MKLDKDSRVVWKLERNTHHDVSVDDDGNIWVPAQHYRPDGIPGFGNLKPWYYEDTVLKVSPDGKVLDEISVLEALRDWPGLSSVTYNEDVKVEVAKPTIQRISTMSSRCHVPWRRPFPSSRRATCCSHCAT